MRKMHEAIKSGEARWSDYMIDVEGDQKTDAAAALKKAAEGKKAADPEDTYACPDEEGIRIKASVCAKCPKAKDCPEYGPSHQ